MEALSFFMKNTYQLIIIIGIIVLIGVLVRKSSNLNYSSHTIKLFNINSVYKCFSQIRNSFRTKQII